MLLFFDKKTLYYTVFFASKNLLCTVYYTLKSSKATAQRSLKEAGWAMQGAQSTKRDFFFWKTFLLCQAATWRFFLYFWVEILICLDVIWQVLYKTWNKTDFRHDIVHAVAVYDRCVWTFLPRVRAVQSSRRSFFLFCTAVWARSLGTVGSSKYF